MFKPCISANNFLTPLRIKVHGNLLVFVVDEAQQIVNAFSSVGFNDHEVVAKIREAKTTVVAAIQSFLSLVPPLKDETRAKVFMANLANRISFRAFDR
jgi:hypothetical protein